MAVVLTLMSVRSHSEHPAPRAETAGATQHESRCDVIGRGLPRGLRISKSAYVSLEYFHLRALEAPAWLFSTLEREAAAAAAARCGCSAASEA